MFVYQFGKLFELGFENFVVVASKSVACDLTFFVIGYVDLGLPVFFEVAPGLEVVN